LSLDANQILPRSIQPSKVHALSKRQEGEIKAQSRPNAALIHETIRAEGEAELERRWWAVLLSGFATLFTENTLVPILPCCITATVKRS